MRQQFVTLYFNKSIHLDDQNRDDAKCVGVRIRKLHGKETRFSHPYAAVQTASQCVKYIGMSLGEIKKKWVAMWGMTYGNSL